MLSKLAMKAFLASSLFATLSVTNALPDDFKIVEIADPKDEYTGRFVQFYTSTGAGQTIGQNQGKDVYLSLYSNGNTSLNSRVKITGEKIGDDGFFVVCRSMSNFATWYPGIDCDLASSSAVNSNGDDVYVVSV